MASSRTPNTSGPAPGDIILARDASGKNAYSLSIFPGPPQVLYSGYEEALSRAGAWASISGGSIWLTQDGRMSALTIEPDSRIPDQ